MLWFFRAIVIFCILNLAVLHIFGGGAGMEKVWWGLLGVSLCLSFKQVGEFIFSKKWFQVLFYSGLSLFILVEGAIIYHGFSLPKESDYLIVLGAKMRGEKPSYTLEKRLLAAYDYLEAHPNTVAILSGGQGKDEVLSEAQGMFRYLKALGISEERLILEEVSTDTEENLTNSLKLLEELGSKEAQISVVTSRFHVLRAKMIGKKLGVKVGGIGAPCFPSLIPTYYLREFFAVLEQGLKSIISI